MLRYINDGNYERAGEGWSFGIGHGASREANRGNANKDEVVLQKMRHLVMTMLHALLPLSGPRFRARLQ
jgi:hypothetical protein